MPSTEEQQQHQHLLLRPLLDNDAVLRSVTTHELDSSQYFLDSDQDSVNLDWMDPTTSLVMTTEDFLTATPWI